MTKKSPIQVRDELKAKYESELYKRAIKKMNAKYDAVDINNDRKRRVPGVETQSEEEILRLYDRHRASAYGRDIERNFSNGKALIRQFRVNVVGSEGGKLRLNTGDNRLDKRVAGWFNGYWAKRCDARDDNHWNDFLQLIIASVKREGDVLCVFDDFMDDNGKLYFFESDQLCAIDEGDWKLQNDWTETVIINGKRTKIPLKQESGVIYDSKGRVQAYVCTSKHGIQSAKMSEVMIVPKTSARLLKNPWRFNQLRGSADMLTVANDLQDLYQMRAKELQSAQVAASFAGVVKKENGMEEALLRGGVDPIDALNPNTGTASTSSEKKTYESFEALTGGMMEYMLPSEDFKILDFNRPNIHLKEFFDFVIRSAGASMGLAECYSMMQANGSYTAYRGEMLMSWQTFQADQKWLERRFCDWVAVKVLDWAQRKGVFSGSEFPSGWQDSISWIWPRMPQIDPEKDYNATNNAIKNGYQNISDVIGPDWETRLETGADQLNKAKELGYPLSAFESVAGAPIQAGKQSTNEAVKNENMV